MREKKSMRKGRGLHPSETSEWYIAQAAAHWLREHGYFVKWDNEYGCYRVMLEGIDRANDKPYPAEFKTVQAAYSLAFRLIAGEK
jgi:hypothetical protein